MLESDIFYMKRALELAAKGRGTTWPNPMVGCVIVKNNKIIGEGFHQLKGQDHAELAALKNCSESAVGSTLYVNLEPCCHTQKLTPPCAQRLIQEKITRVVIANLDPHPEVNGRGCELLRSHGIKVDVGICEGEGEILNEVFFHAQRNKRPFIHFKSAMSLDGKIALSNGKSQWISGMASREHVHELRSQHQAIMTGAGTIRSDNPQLTIRRSGQDTLCPLRVVVTRSGDLNSDARVFNDEFKHQTVVYSMRPLDLNVSRYQIISSLSDVFDDLFQKNIISILVESGPGLATELLKHELIDRVSLYLNPSFLGDGKSIFQNLGLTELTQRPLLSQCEISSIGDDFYLTAKIQKGSLCSLA